MPEWERTRLLAGGMGNHVEVRVLSIPPMNKSKYVSENRRRKAAYVRAFKKRPCEDCECDYPYWVMHFDHVRGQKEFQLSKVTQTNISLVRLRAELDKCDVVCANCHALRHPPAHLEFSK